MLIVAIPVIFLTLYFAWKYRASNTAAAYHPDWSHSTAIEVVIWTIPSIIVAYLAVITWSTTHHLDPYRPLDSNVKPINVDVVSLDWKWLFIYPDLGVASVNELAIPTGTPVNFRLTSDSVMNSFFIPRLGTQIYTMAGMETQDHLIADQAGTFDGMSTNFSGPGFSDMNFSTLAMPQAQFDQWVQKVRGAPGNLDAAAYKQLAVQSEANPVVYYSKVDAGMFHSILTENGGMQMSMPMQAQASAPAMKMASQGTMSMSMPMNSTMSTSATEH
jgi:cytochrome o ubiquinol oxidase subunit 2